MSRSRPVSPRAESRRRRAGVDPPSPAVRATARHGAATAGPRHGRRRGPTGPIGRREPRLVLAAIAMSGFTALASEVIWTRQLALVFGATVYAFSLILAVFLAGLGVGSSVGAALIRVWPRPRIALGWCQLLLAFAGVGAAHLLSQIAAELAGRPVTQHGGAHRRRSSTSSSARWSSFPARCCGARVFRWRSRPPQRLPRAGSRGRGMTAHGWSAGWRRPTRLAPSPARSRRT